MYWISGKSATLNKYIEDINLKMFKFRILSKELAGLPYWFTEYCDLIKAEGYFSLSSSLNIKIDDH